MNLTQTAIEKLTNKGTWVFIPKSMSSDEIFKTVEEVI